MAPCMMSISSFQGPAPRVRPRLVTSLLACAALCACEPMNVTEDTPLPMQPRNDTEPDDTQPDDTQPDEDADARMSQLLEDGERQGFQGVLLVEVAGVRRVETGMGTLSERSTRVPDSDTAFDCGSIMKDITQAALFLLQEQGLVSLSQTLGELFDEAPEVWRDVTLEQVLTHRAGFDEYHDTEGDFEEMDRATALATILAQEPLFEPGTESAYSNSGYTLLALVIERVTGEDYTTVVRRLVFDPLHMARSGFYGEPLWTDGNVAVGSGADVYLDNDPSRWPAPSWALIGNGGLVSTLNDLLSFARALDGDALFQPTTREAFARAQPSGSIAGEPVYGYAGGNDFGFDVVIGQVPTDDTIVLGATHVASPVNVEELAVDLLEALYGEAPEIPPSD